MRLKVLLLIIFWGGWSFTDAKDASQMAGKPFPEQCRIYDSLIYTFWDDSSVTMSEHFEPYIAQAIEQNDEELELMMKIWLNWEAYDAGEISESTYLSQHKTLVSKCKKKKLNHLLTLTYLAHSSYLMKTGRRAKATQYHLMAYDLYKDMDPAFFIYKKIYLMGLGGSYYGFKDYQKALKYLHEAAAVHTAFEPGLYNTIGLAHYMMGNDDSSHYYFDSAYRYSVEADRYDWQVILTGNLVKPLIRRKQYDSAIVLAETALALSQNYWEKIIRCRNLATLANLYRLKNELGKAESYYKMAIECHADESMDNWYYKHLYSSVRIFEEYAQLKRAQGNYAQAYVFLDSARHLRDSLYKRDNLDRVVRMELELSQNKLDNTNKLLVYQQTEISTQRNLLIVGIIAIAMIMLFLSSVYRRRRDKFENEKNLAAYSLQISQDKLTNFTKSIQEKNKVLEGLELQLKSYADNENAVQYQESISELRSSTILTDDDWAQFRDVFEKVHVGYLSRLNEKYPSLTPSEIRYFVLVKLCMDNKEMASVLGVSSAGVRTIKYRIIKKLSLTEDAQLEQLINNI